MTNPRVTTLEPESRRRREPTAATHFSAFSSSLSLYSLFLSTSRFLCAAQGDEKEARLDRIIYPGRARPAAGPRNPACPPMPCYIRKVVDVPVWLGPHARGMVSGATSLQAPVVSATPERRAVLRWAWRVHEGRKGWVEMVLADPIRVLSLFPFLLQFMFWISFLNSKI
jgi:hypothetical protein